MEIFVIPLFAVLNRARGSQFFELLKSTVEGRLVSMGGMAFGASLSMWPNYTRTLEMFIFSWAALMLWCTPAWDAYWSAAIGNEKTRSRLWGLGAMTLRMTLILPYFISLAYFMGGTYLYALGALTLGSPYYIAGYVYKKAPIMVAEYSVGAIIGIITYFYIS